jgi:dihydrodipicolinate synthase/N-acetylneuraminate lyase
VVYNVPGLSKVSLTSALLTKILDKVDNIVAVKDATKDLTQLSDTIRTIGKRVPVIAGAEGISYFGLLAGSPGATSAVANFAPNLVVDMYRAIKNNEITTASSIFFEKILPFRHLDVPAVLQGIPIQNVYVKEAMNLLGMRGGRVRPPLTQLTAEKMDELKQFVAIMIESSVLAPYAVKQQ